MDVNPHSAYHAAGIKLLPGGVGVNDVACSGGIRRQEHSIVLPDARYTLRTRTTYAQAFPSVAAYVSASHSAMHTPVDVTGFEPAKASLQNRGLPNLLSTHPTILFWLGNRRPRDGRTDVLLLASASGSRGARPGRHLTRALPPTPSAPGTVPTAPAGVADELGEDIPN